MRTINNQNNSNNSLIWLLISIILLVLMSSCDITKKAAKTKKDIKETTTEKTTTINKGGSIVSDILPEDERPKDYKGNLKDTIVVVKKDEITKTIYYKPDGSVRTQVDCPDTLVTNEKTSTKEDKSKEKESEKTEDFDAKVILYSFLGLGILLMIGGAIFIYIINKQLAPFTKVLDKLN